MNIDDLKSNWNSISFPPGYGGVPETACLLYTSDAADEL